MRLKTVLLLLVLSPTLLCGCNKTGDDEEKQKNGLPPLHAEPEQPKKQKDKAKNVEAKSAPFVAAKDGRVYHKRGCIYAAHLDSPVGFSSMRDAEVSGHIPCVFCLGGQEQTDTPPTPPPASPSKTQSDNSRQAHRPK